MPVLILSTYNEDGTIDSMNAAWGTMEDNDVVLIELTKDHRTSQNIERLKAFTISYLDAGNVEAGDYVGLVSGNQEPRKFEKTGWTAIPSKCVNAPIIEQLPITLECELDRISTENGDFVVYGRIKNVSVREDLINEDGKLDYEKCNLLTYNSYDHSYRMLGSVVAKAFSVGLKKR